VIFGRLETPGRAGERPPASLDHLRQGAQNHGSHRSEVATIRVLIVDDHPVTRERLHAALDLANDVVIVGEANSAETAIEKVRELAPDIVFMDVEIPRIGAIEATKAIRQSSPEIRVILFMGHESRAAISEAVQAGVSGYLPEDVDAEELMNAVRLVMEGMTPVHPALTAVFIEEFQPAEKRIASPPLSKREQEIFAMFTQGAGGIQIARHLGISPRTVRTSVQRILDKLGVHDRMQAHALGLRAERVARDPRWRRRVRLLSAPHLRRILLESREDALRQKGKAPSTAGRASGRRFLGRVFDELSEADLRDAVQDLSREMPDDEFDRLVERTKT
jgi:DNA-binding NarL/FixJ family response regulator